MGHSFILKVSGVHIIITMVYDCIMKIYTCKDFKGHWPTESAAIVVAKDESHAFELLRKVLRCSGLDLEGHETLEELDVVHPNATLLQNGIY